MNGIISNSGLSAAISPSAKTRIIRRLMQLMRYLPALLLVLMVLTLLGMLYFAKQWNTANAINIAYQNKTLLDAKQDIKLHHQQSHLALMQADLMMHEKLTHESLKAIIHALTVAESAKDPNIRALAKHMTGNLYFDWSSVTANVKGGAHQQAVAQIALAREAYKGSLRIKPNLYESRFNLELIDRLSPEHRTQAWLSETDGVKLQPFKKNGTAMMRDNRRRGLP